MPATTREILLDPLTAQRLDVGLGDTVRVERFGPAIDLAVVGIRDRPILGALQKPSVIVDGTVIEEAT